MNRKIALATALLFLVAGGAQANPFELFGFTPRSVGLGGAMTGLADDLAGSFYNPAGMLGHTKSEFGFGFADTFSNLHIDRTSASSTIHSSQTESSPRFEGGIIFPLGGALFKDRVVLGVGFGHPMGSLIRVQTVDQSQPQFYMYQSKAQRFALSFGVGIKIFEGLSIGAGAQVIAEQLGKVRFQIDLASRRFVSRDITVDLNTIPTPLAGILIEPNDWLKIGLSWRKEASLYYEQPTDLDLGDIGDLKLGVAGIAQFWPHVFSAGASIKAGNRLTISTQVDYLLWSRAPRDQVQVVITPTGPVLDGLGLSDVLGFGSQDVRPGFANVFVPHLGIELTASDFLTLRAGGWVRPAVTPDQNGSTNYLDNFTEAVSAGATFKFIDPLKVFTDPVSLDLAGAAIFANERTTSKRQATDATGNSSYGGMLLSFSGMLRYLY